MMSRPSDEAEEQIAPHRLALEQILTRLEKLDPETTYAAEMERSREVAARLKAAIQALRVQSSQKYVRQSSDATILIEAITKDQIERAKRSIRKR
jgi:hypothetical protein